MAGEETLTYPPVAGRSPTPVPGNLRGSVGPSGETGVVIDNRTDLPDHLVQQAIADQWVEVSEFAGLQFGQPSNFQLYSNNAGSMLARTPFRTPMNVIEEIKLARSVVDTDDDIAGTIGLMIALAYGEGFQNHHEDEDTLEWFNQICKPVNSGMLRIQKEMYREYLISAAVTTLALFTRSRLSYYPRDGGDQKTAQLAIPRVGVLPAENIRVITNDVLGQGELAYKVENDRLKQWLDEFFATPTSAGRRAQMALEEPVTAAVFTGKVHVDWNDSDMFSAGQDLYTLNPRMVHRTTMAKGASPYPRPPLTRNFALLEAKRLLNIMDYALLQGGTNYLVVARKGTDQWPAQQGEVDNLIDQVRTASRSGVMVGDHRLDVEIITPKLDELLQPAKRKLIGRKISMALLRIPEQVTNDAGQAGAQMELEYTSRVITSDRGDLKDHQEATIYEETANRNRATFSKGPPSVWHPKLTLAGTKDFWTGVLQARDRGDIPRRWAVETLGFDWDAGVAERKREIARGEDDIMAPASVPWSQQPGGHGAPGQADPYAAPPNGAPGGGPPDNQQGRPVGSSSSNGRPGGPAPALPSARPRQVIQRNAGETIRAFMEEGELIRIGELTQAVLDEYPDAELGRVTTVEREAIDANEPFVRGPVSVIPVNPEYGVREIRALRLTEGLSLVVGNREQDSAIVAKALCFREPQWSTDEAEERAMAWGFVTAVRHHPDPERMKHCKNCGNEMPSYSQLCPNCDHDPDADGDYDPPGAPNTDMAKLISLFTDALNRIGHQPIVIQQAGERPKKILRDDQGSVIGTVPMTDEEIEAAKTDGKYIYIKCGHCGLIQDAAHDHCARCGQDLTEARKAMFVEYEQKGEKPPEHSVPPPPPSQQRDYRKDQQ